ncbi:hypothetical protein [Gordonia sihwensis]|uniref:hypothetical protein n=1 Tax=Gordonia sihwensis TaxID=173559 RepID=UPI0005EDA003|nr:hypothetical protein [Gordonia sihwensis]KJR10441.1 hypothetical protein UG54_00090 [Gordonia sihwensis]
MSVALDRDIASIIMLIGAAIGLSLGAVGAIKARTPTLLIGVAVLFYSLTGLTYVPLMGAPAEPLDMMSRVWGAMTAVIAGACILGVVSENRNTLRGVADGPRSRWTILLSMIAAVSLAAIYYVLKPYSDLPASTDFLNEYGHLPGVFVYQIIFAIWIAVPASSLGFSLGRTSSLGWPRWLVAAGGACAAAWGIWKVGGVFGAVAGIETAAASPVSVALGLSALVLCVSGLVIIRWRELIAARRERIAYRQERAAEDELFRSTGSGSP